MTVEILHPQWDAPPSVRAVCTLRSGGVSVAPFANLNLGSHAGDDPTSVAENRRRVRLELALPSEPSWLQQVHGTQVFDVDTDTAAALIADAAVTRSADRVLAIQVADCMPVLFASDDGAVIAAAHAGWRGLAAGVLEAATAAMNVEPGTLHVWLGPAISAEHFEVGDDVRAEFMAHDECAALAFQRNARGRWQCDLTLLARQRLAAMGISQISVANLCTYEQDDQCFSYRRDGRTGRMAALIWRAGG